MLNPTLEINKIAQQAVKAGHPEALQILAFQNHKQIFKHKWGKSFQYFDLASLTKILITNQLVMHLYERKLLDIGRKAGFYLGFLKNSKAGQIPIHRFLSHNSGLIWWRPFYENLMKFDLEERRSELQRKLRKEEVKIQKQCVYSDLDYFMLGWILEEILNMPLDQAAREIIFSPLNLKNTFYVRGKSRQFKKFAPTEVNSWRGRVQGEVHDDNAWSLGGVAPHAGLFSTLEETGILAENFLRIYNGESSKIYSRSTLRKFAKRQVPPKRGDWSLGFMLPTKPHSSAGENISSIAFGHTGFTGTSIWVDPVKNSTAIIISNRTYPSRDNIRFRELRPLLYDCIWRMTDG